MGIKYNAEFIDAIKRKKTKNMTEEEIEAEKRMDEEIKKIGFRKIV